MGTTTQELTKYWITHELNYDQSKIKTNKLNTRK